MNKPNRLNIYTISNEYINFLQEYEKQYRGYTKVSNYQGATYSHSKPYIGIILQLNGILYFAPLTHPKEHYENKKHFFNKLSVPIYDNELILGRIMLCYMIPLPTLPTPIKINSIKDKAYRNLLQKQYFFLQTHEKEIIKRANSLYKKALNREHYLHKFCCDFKILENACKLWMYQNQEINLKSSLFKVKESTAIFSYSF